MGVEHSKGTQKLCYINAEKEEECFRNDYETHNVFEMGFDIIQKDIGDGQSHEERHHEFTSDPSSKDHEASHDFHDYKIDPELLKQRRDIWVGFGLAFWGKNIDIPHKS